MPCTLLSTFAEEQRTKYCGKKLNPADPPRVGTPQRYRLPQLGRLIIIEKRDPERTRSKFRKNRAKVDKMAQAIDASPRILSSGWGKMEVEKIGRSKDVKLWPGGGRSWDWSECGTDHDRGIQQGDLEELMTNGCRVVILTTGRMKRLKVPQQIVECLKEQSIEVIVADTERAVQIYNEYASKGMAVGGLFHSTC